MVFDHWPGFSVLACALALAACCRAPQPPARTSGERLPAPATVSPPWQALLGKLGPPPASPSPAPEDGLAWRLRRFSAEEIWKHLAAPVVEKLGPRVTGEALGGVPVLRVRPREWTGGRRLAVYVHGGAWTTLSARSSLVSAALFAARTGLEVVSIDYTLAPMARWPAPLLQIEAVFKALRAQGVNPADVVLFGDSAGGNLATAGVLRMREDGLPLPGALVLWSPCTDLGTDGDSRITLAGADPVLRPDTLQAAGLAYAAAADDRRPQVSPVYADFSGGFPPTLIQAGTREMLLSDAVRLYQAMDQGGVDVRLDLYEGMPHVFQIFIVDAPESLLALRKVKRFVERSLGGAP